MLVQRVDSGKIHVSRHATWGMSVEMSGAWMKYLSVKKLFPLRALPAKVRLRVLRDILGHETAFASIYGIEMELPIKDRNIGAALMVYRERELDQLEIIRRSLTPGQVILEIGANFGYYLLVGADAIGWDGFIYAIEPNPKNIALLRRNIALHRLEKKTLVKNIAVSNFDGQGQLYIAEQANLSALGPTRGNGSESFRRGGFSDRKYLNSIPVECWDFGRLIRFLDRKVDLVRMDIEGYEVEVLESLARQLEDDPNFPKAPNTFVFEPHSWEYDERSRSLNCVLKRLARHGYRISMMGSRDESNSPFHKYGYYPIYTARELRGKTRGVYSDIMRDDAFELASFADGVTTVCLSRSPKTNGSNRTESGSHR